MLNNIIDRNMNTRIKSRRHWAIVLLSLLAWMPMTVLAQTDQFEMVVEKIDGTKLAFSITDDYPVLQYMYGGDDGVNTLEIQTADGTTSVPCPEIKRLFTLKTIAIKGDANGDKEVNVADIVKLVNDKAPQSEIDEVVDIIMKK